MNGTSTFIDGASESRDPVVPVGELELGLEVCRPNGSARAFGQIGLVGQQWWSAGSASRAVETETFSGSPVDSDFGFLGLAIRLGVSY